MITPATSARNFTPTSTAAVTISAEGPSGPAERVTRASAESSNPSL